MEVTGQLSPSTFPVFGCHHVMRLAQQVLLPAKPSYALTQPCLYLQMLKFYLVVCFLLFFKGHQNNKMSHLYSTQSRVVTCNFSLLTVLDFLGTSVWLSGSTSLTCARVCGPSHGSPRHHFSYNV